MIVVIVVCNRGSSFVNVGLLVSTSSIFNSHSPYQVLLSRKGKDIIEEESRFYNS